MSAPSRIGSASIGIDVGGTKIAAAVVTATGEVLVEERTPTPPCCANGASASLECTFELASRLSSAAAALGVDVGSIGVGVPELVGPAGTIETAAVIDWRGRDADGRLSAIAPVVIESDVRAAAIAEGRSRGGEIDPFVYVSIGTGISYCLIAGGQPYRGARGHAILLGGIEIESGLTLEQYASGGGLEIRSGKPARLLLAEADAGEPHAVELVRAAGAAVGHGLATLMNLLDPAAIVIGGGLGLAGGVYRGALEASLTRATWGADIRSPVVLEASLGDRAGVIGAAMLAMAAGDTERVPT